MNLTNQIQQVAAGLNKLKLTRIGYVVGARIRCSEAETLAAIIELGRTHKRPGTGGELFA